MADQPSPEKVLSDIVRLPELVRLMMIAVPDDPIVENVFPETTHVMLPISTPSAQLVSEFPTILILSV